MRLLKGLILLPLLSSALYGQTLQSSNSRTLSSANAPTMPNEMLDNSAANNWKVPNVPKSVTFAGEKVPLDRWEVNERLDRELLTNSFMHTSTFYILKLKTRYFPTIERILKEQGVPEDFKYLCVAESSLQNLRSPAGAEGMWQFLAATARSYGLEVNDNVDERYNLEKATVAACKYLKEAKAKFGTWTAAAASYNCGMGGYNGYATYQGSKNYYDLLLPEETNRYIFRIIALKLILESPKQYGFNILPAQKYKPFNTKKVTVTSTISDLNAWAKSQGSSYKLVRLVNPWIKGKTIPNASGKSYVVEVPVN